MTRSGNRASVPGGVALWLCALLCALLVGLPVAQATEADLNVLPVTDPFRCLACHFTESPSVGDDALNVFGQDFLDNGRIWDSELAQIDSDGDGCLNGVEIGDSDGDGHPDGNVTEQTGNPGIVDECGAGSLVDEKTWSELKALFDGN